jgi:hypothetical protein
MSVYSGTRYSPNKTTVKFWEGMEADLDLDTLARSAIPVKGVACPFPLRFLEIYAGFRPISALRLQAIPGFAPRGRLSDYALSNIEATFLRGLPEGRVGLGDNVAQPPFAWRDADAGYLSVSFTYNTNAFFRILSGLRDAGRIPSGTVNRLLDQACHLLGQLYRTEDHFLIRNINNNFNMLLISRVLEFLVGREIYDSDMQEMDLTRRALAEALRLASGYEHLSPKELMGISVATGVAFVESRLGSTGLGRSAAQQTLDVTWRYNGQALAIDDREHLLRMIADSGLRKNSFTLAVILDDATETVADLLWMMAALEQFPFLKINLLVNTAQISINFSARMLDDVFRSACFKGLADLMGSRLLVTRVYCPFISFQTEYLPLPARRILDEADAIYVKGAKFFETCQIPHKETFYAFVVYGPISRLYTGLRDFDAVFAYLPAGTTGYIHNRDCERIVTLKQIIGKRPGSPDARRAEK